MAFDVADDPIEPVAQAFVRLREAEPEVLLVAGSERVPRGDADVLLGWRLTPAGPAGPGFEVSLDATRSESAGGDTETEHGIMLRGTMRW